MTCNCGMPLIHIRMCRTAVSGNAISLQNPQLIISEVWMIPNLKWGDNLNQVHARGQFEEQVLGAQK